MKRKELIRGKYGFFSTSGMYGVPRKTIKDYLATVRTVEALDAWARSWKLENDADVINRRTELAAIAERTENEKKEEKQENKTREKVVSYEESNVETHEFTIREKGKRFFKKKVIEETIYEITFDTEKYKKLKLIDMEKSLKNMFSKVLKEKSSKDNDLVRVYIEHEDLFNPIIIPPTQVANLSANYIMSEVARVLQSAEHIELNKSLIIHIGIAKMYESGRGHRLISVTGNAESLRRKRSVIQMKNTKDNLCAARAIILGYFHTKRKNSETDSKIYLMLRKSKAKLAKMAKEFHLQAGIGEKEYVSLPDLRKFECLLDVSITVVSAIHNNMVIYNGQVGKTRVYLYMVQEDCEKPAHYHTITNLKGFLGYQNYCEVCHVGFGARYKHSCSSWCDICLQPDCSYTYIKTNSIQCSDCNAVCRSSVCFSNHKKKIKKNKPACELFWYCPHCGQRVKKNGDEIPDHECGKRLCNICGKMSEANHDCYVRAETPSKKCDKFAFFDFECNQETGEHIPNLVVIRTCCNYCKDKPDASKCFRCGNRCKRCDKWNAKKKIYQNDQPCLVGECGDIEIIFKGSDTKKKCCSWFFDMRRHGFTIIAHNLAGYDGVMLMEHLIRNSLNPEVIYNGTKILYIHIRKLSIRVLDSFKFLPMPLSAFPKSLGFPDLAKGYFPYLFNTTENENYVGPMPAQIYYNPDGMKTKERKRFEGWYETQKNETFDLQKEMEKYCRSDVDILKRGCMIFRDIILEKTDGVLDPFQYVTIAGVCMGMFKYMFLEENWMLLLKKEALQAKQSNRTALWIPGVLAKNCFKHPNGTKIDKSDIEDQRFISSPIAITAHETTDHKKHSKIAMQWLLWYEDKLRREGKNVTIQHALNGGEKVICHSTGSYKVDGYVEIDGVKTVLEFWGDYWHGSVMCYPQSARENIHDVKDKWRWMKERRIATFYREKKLKELGYQLITIWEHEFRKLIASDPSVAAFVKNLDLSNPLNPRDAFYGGRTEGFRLLYEKREDEQGHYGDVVSEYPAVMKYGEYPVGHPIKIVRGFQEIEAYFGIAKIAILPPRGLYIPVLPVRVNGKLYFPLCRTCAENQNQHTCTCDDKKRTLYGTWCTPEIMEAIQNGYKVIKIYEVHHWINKTNTLFKDYINTFIRMKQEASGFPSTVQSEEEKLKFMEEFKNKEGIALKYENVKINPGLRSVSKLILNCLWGKFVQHPNLEKNTFVSDEKQFYNLVTDTTRVICNYNVLDSDIASVVWKYKSGFIPSSKNSNVYIAAFTTCHARLRLYQLLKITGWYTLYSDTDSVMYFDSIYNPLPLPMGNYLNEVKDELTCEHVGCAGCDRRHHIVTFVGAGVKNYAYKTDTGSNVVKIRGFSITSGKEKSLNLPVLYRMATEEKGLLVETKENIIKRDKQKCIVYNKEEIKKYRTVFDKRVAQADFTSLPYGF